MEIFDRWNYELEEENNLIKVANLAETYYSICSHDVLRKEIDVETMEKRIQSCEKFKAKDLFNILSVTSNKNLVKHLVTKIKEVFPVLIPEEIVVMNQMIAKHNL